VASYVDVPAREARAVHVRRGASFRVIDVEGGQVVDLFAFSAEDVREYQSAEHTRVHVARLFPRIGEQFVTNRRRPILTLEEDTTDGTHDMLHAACDPTRYALLGVQGWHASCQENLRTVMAELGYVDVEVPQPINLFMDIPVYPDGSIGCRAAKTRAGDSVRFRAEMDCIVVCSACPQDMTGINSSQPSRIAIALC
jgi:uncharacterized protein YcgI (DUF1989 family)